MVKQVSFTANAFSRAANTYDDAAILHRSVSACLFEHLDPILLQPQTIIDLGCNTGRDTQKLRERYPTATIYSVDIAWGMLQKTAQSMTTPHCLGARAEQLPLASESIDLVYANLVLPWCHYVNAFQEIARVLRVGGLFIFSTYGPDTLRELRYAWQCVDEYPHVHEFIDMHHVGDMLMQQQLGDPVLDVEYFNFSYKKAQTILKDLRAVGAVNQRADRRKTLLGKQRFTKFMEVLENQRTADGYLPLTYEVIYGHAWKSRPVAKTIDGVTRIPVSVLKQ